MTKRLYATAAKVKARILEGGGVEAMEPVMRDAWASLLRWHRAGERVWRIGDEEPTTLPDELQLASAPPHADAVCYSGPDRREWIVVARHQAGQPIEVTEAEVFAFPDPMLTYVTMVREGLAAGCINLEEQPTWGALYLPAGASERGWLQQEEIAEEEVRFRRALAHFYRRS